jgi:hypothetical protein
MRAATANGPVRLGRIIRVLIVFLLVLYVSSYLVLSRRGYAVATRLDMPRFYYVLPWDLDELDRVGDDRRLFLHGVCTELYSPLNWIDCLIGTGREPARGTLLSLGRKRKS